MKTFKLAKNLTVGQQLGNGYYIISLKKIDGNRLIIRTGGKGAPYGNTGFVAALEDPVCVIES